MISKPLAIDLFCGLGGWTEGLLAEGYYVVGFDIHQHIYGEHRYPAQIVIQDVLTLHGKQFKDAALIVASPPCQAYSYRAMPWKRAKALPPPDNSLFDACFRIQREASEAAGHHIPMVVENVRGAIPWVGRSRWNYGSFHLWGDVPALMPMTGAIKNTGVVGLCRPQAGNAPQRTTRTDERAAAEHGCMAIEAILCAQRAPAASLENWQPLRSPRFQHHSRGTSLARTFLMQRKQPNERIDRKIDDA